MLSAGKGSNSFSVAVMMDNDWNFGFLRVCVFISAFGSLVMYK